MASFIASTQKSASSVFEMRQAKTLRVRQSIPLMVCRQAIAHCPAGYACMPERGALDGHQI
jgi:hypothetical protein